MVTAITRRIATFGLILVAGLFLCPGPAQAADAGLTFFGWSDQHVKTDGDGKHLLPAVDAMNSLPGTKYPAQIGGVVAEPAFVLGCGDITEWPTTAAKNTYDELLTQRLKFPSYDVIGNHDEGGNSPSETIKKWIVARHGGLSYAFDRGGVHFVVLFSKFEDSLNNPAQPITREALEYLKKDLSAVPKARPVVVAMHLCFDSITNRDELVGAFGDANVIMVLGGHYHKSRVDRFRDMNFVQLSSPAPNGSHEVTVVRITAGRLVAIPYHYERKVWSEGPGKMLNVAIRGPAGP
jgi:hypothetical protein